MLLVASLDDVFFGALDVSGRDICRELEQEPA